jgi:transposase
VRAAILLDSVAGLSDQAIARAQGVNRNTVMLCIQKCLRFGVQAALGELPRSGKPRRVSDAAMAGVQNCAGQKPKELGYAQQLWTYDLLTAHLRLHSGASAENARPAAPTRTACQTPGLRIQTAGNGFLASGAGSAPWHSPRDCQRDAPEQGLH